MGQPLASDGLSSYSSQGVPVRPPCRGGGRVAVGNENPPILLLTSSSQAEGVVAQRAEQILTATKVSQVGVLIKEWWLKKV